jgi:hypothetical protein
MGYIPLSVDDCNYKTERAREVECGFSVCKCSNCEPEAAKDILEIFQQMSIENFDQMLDAPQTIPKDLSIVPIVRQRNTQKDKKTCNLSYSSALHMANSLVQCFNVFYQDIFGSSPYFEASDFFNIDRAQALVGSLDQIGGEGPHNLRIMEKVIGGEWFSGQLISLSKGIQDWYGGDYFQTVLEERRAHEQFIVSEEKRLREEIQFESEEVQLLNAVMAAENKRHKKEEADKSRAKRAHEKAIEKALAASIKKRKAEDTARAKEVENTLALELKKKKESDVAEVKAADRKLAAIRHREEMDKAAEEKKVDRERRAKARNEERAAAAARKAEEARQRKETKDNNKRKALVNRQNMVTQKARKLATRMNTDMVLAEFNNSLTINPADEARHSLMEGVDSAPKMLDPSGLDPDC